MRLPIDSGSMFTSNSIEVSFSCQQSIAPRWWPGYHPAMRTELQRKRRVGSKLNLLDSGRTR